MTSTKNKILIATALELEFKEVRKHLDNVEKIRHPEVGSTYEKGTYKANNQVYEVLLIETGAGNIFSTGEVRQAISFFKPDAAFFVGVAGGIKDVVVSDVIASDSVIGAEMGKVAPPAFIPRFQATYASYALVELARQVVRDNTWFQKSKYSKEVANPPKAIVGPIAAGEKVVADFNSPEYQRIKQHASHAKAIEMEGIGFLLAARPYKVDAIVIRGISDMIAGKNPEEDEENQPRAAAHAAAFTYAIIDEFGFAHNQDLLSATERFRTDLNFRKKLTNKLAELYPRGPEDRDIWERAGGDLSLLTNADNRRSQWFTLIKLLAQGGGGQDISFQSLLDEVCGDFPDLPSEVKELFAPS